MINNLYSHNLHTKIVRSIFAQLDNLQERAFVVAFSGGLDSTLLLNLVKLYADSQDGVTLRAVHIDHGNLFATGMDYTKFCRQWCKTRTIALTIVKLDIVKEAAQNLEQLARVARYQAFSEQLGDNEVLLLGHHLDDQLETLMLRLNRGSGLHGLTAIPKSRKLGKSRLWRPLLDLQRSEIKTLAEYYLLDWIEDPANTDISFDRNFIRHSIIKQLRQRWPDISSRWRVSIEVLQQQKQALEWLCQQQMKSIDCRAMTMSAQTLRSYPLAVQKELILYWLRQHGLNVPRKTVLEEISDKLILVTNSSAIVDIPQSQSLSEPLCLRGYRDNIYLLAKNRPHLEGEYYWNPAKPLELPHGILTVHWQSTELLPSSVTWQVRFRKSYTTLLNDGYHSNSKLKIRMQGKRHSTLLKNLFQQKGIAPWLRDYLPLVFDVDKLIAVAHLGVDQSLDYRYKGIYFNWLPKTSFYGHLD